MIASKGIAHAWVGMGLVAVAPCSICGFDPIRPGRSRRSTAADAITQQKTENSASSAATVAITQEKAERIAIKEHLRRGGSKARVQSATWGKDVWSVLLVSLPEMPGGHLLVEISSDGKVLRVFPGA